MVVAEKERIKDEGVIIELRAKSQITLPKKLLKQVGMKEGDNFEAVVVNGQIHLIPVVIYPKAVVEQWEKEFIQAQRDLAMGKIKAYKNVEEMRRAFESGSL